MLWENANKQLQKVNSDIEGSQIEAAKGRADFYDKLTFGAGATIAALVSFLGVHSTKLHPAWIFRGALLSLVLTVVAGLFRNYRYPNYVLQIHKISFIRCTRFEQQCRLNFYEVDHQADPDAIIALQTGKPFNMSQFTKDIEKANEELEPVLRNTERIAERLQKQWTYAQNFSIGFALIAAIFLVWLAIANF